MTEKSEKPKSEPQWSRSLKSGVTLDDPDGPVWREDAAMEPLVEERSDQGNVLVPFVAGYKPQWSRSLKSGVTTGHAVRPPLNPLAAMEPLVEERSDSAKIG